MQKEEYLKPTTITIFQCAPLCASSSSYIYIYQTAKYDFSIPFPFIHSLFFLFLNLASTHLPPHTHLSCFFLFYRYFNTPSKFI